MNYELQEAKARDLHVNAIAYGEMNDLSVDDVCGNGLRKVLSLLHEFEPEARTLREKLIEYGKKNKKKTEDGKEIIGYQYVDPYVGRVVFDNALDKKVKTISINKKNIELRLQVSVREYINNHVDVNDNFHIWLETIQDKSTYGLYDVALSVIIYRVGRYSYFAIEPFCEYFDPCANMDRAI